MSDYESKYLKYKIKYLELSKQLEINKKLKNLSGGLLEQMPKLCFGTAQNNLGEILPKALELGYRHIDGADAYGDISYRTIIKNSIKTIDRKDLWITWKSDNITIANIKKVLTDLDIAYIDLFLIHFTCGTDGEMDILTEAVKQGLIRYFGVSNCYSYDSILELKNKYNIYANQIQGRAPNGKVRYSNGSNLLLSIKRSGKDPYNFEEFLDDCNEIGVNIMLFGSVSSIINTMFGNQHNSGNSESDYVVVGRLFENRSIINQYYMQKYIFNKAKKANNNVLMVSSSFGSSLVENLTNFDKISKGEDVLNFRTMADIEADLSIPLFERM